MVKIGKRKFNAVKKICKICGDEYYTKGKKSGHNTGFFAKQLFFRNKKVRKMHCKTCCKECSDINMKNLRSKAQSKQRAKRNQKGNNAQREYYLANREEILKKRKEQYEKTKMSKL